MTNKAFQSLYCAWNSLQIWGLVENGEIIHLSFDRERHRTAAGQEALETLCQATQQQVCAFLLRTLQGASCAFPQESPFIRRGTPFQHMVWRVLSRIPFGTTRTYGEIAHELGNAKQARAVGQACNRNPLPLIIPCHRVVSRAGLGGFAGGSEIKKALLAHEQAWLKREFEK